MRSFTREVLLRDADYMSMSRSLEVRVPLRDRELVEYAFALPEAARRPTDPHKRWLVEAVGDRLPEEIPSRSKSFISLRFDRWMRGPLEEFCRESIEVAAERPALRANPVEAALRNFGRSTLHWSRPWLLVGLGRWLEREGIG